MRRRLALRNANHERVVLGGLALVLIVAFAALSRVTANTNIKLTAPGDTGRASTLIDQRFGSDGKAAVPESQEVVVFSSPSLSVDDPSYRQTVEGLMQQLSALRVAKTHTAGGVTLTAGDPIVTSIQTTYDTGLPRDQSSFVARNASGGDVSFALVKLTGNDQELLDKVAPVIDTVTAAQKTAHDLEIELGGDVTTTKESNDLTNKDLGRSLFLNLPITFILLLLAFGTAVAFAGVTVLLSVSGMFLIGNPVFTSLVVAAIIVVALAIIVSLTILPALLGDGLNRLHIPFLYREQNPGGGIWGHICDAVVKHALVFALGTVAGLLLLAAPVLSLNLGFNGAAGLPDQVAAKRSTLLLQRNFTLSNSALDSRSPY
jgi:uncharacterized membrane protein YdfJ with MMPL/SSD domain